MGKKKYHKQNCNSAVRAVVHLGNEIISLVGTHAFEWSIVKQTKNKVNILTFSNREMAVKDFEKYKNLEHESRKR